MNANGEPSCICEEKPRSGAKGTQWTEFAFDLACPFHFPHSTTHEREEDHERTD